MVPLTALERVAVRRVVFALSLLVASGFVLGGLWLFAVRSLEDLPARRSLQEASARVTTAPEGEVRIEPERKVRYVERDGIVAPKPEGPLTRAASTVVVPPPPGPEPVRHKLVVVEDAGVIDVRTHTVRLAHIEAPAAADRCPGRDGRTWPCGARARTALRRFVRRRAVDCLEVDRAQREGEVRLASCTVGGRDLAAWLVEHGWATPTPDAPEALAELHAGAVREGRGVFAADGR
ncbi:thermonuclease family protein [Acuticoccus sp.]|uniref:thermonuclease family protein n=1 Tax=Acuticoccus sp. TaxID=1904378 RepID=UPI003B51A2FC